MPSEIIQTTPLTGTLSLVGLTERADILAARSRSARTTQLYAADWAEFEAWCRMAEVVSIPANPETIALYVTHLSALVDARGRQRLKPSSMNRRLAAIAAAHRDAGFDSPTATDRVRRVMAGIRRTGDATVRRKWPLLTDDVTAMIVEMRHDVWPDGVKAARDTLAIITGYAGALRRSSVAAIRAGDVTITADGLIVRLPKSKTDQEGVGRSVVLPYGTRPVTCPVCAWVRWTAMVAVSDAGGDPMALVLDTPPVAEWEHICRTAPVAALPDDALVFRPLTRAGVILDRPISTDALYQAVRVRAEAAGLDPSKYGFHSLRAGFVTQARRNGASARKVRLQTLHSSDRMVDIYDREYNPLAAGNAVTKIGL